VEVEIWSDIVCPWCYIGKRRFEAALLQFEHADAVSVTYRSFELDPHAPAERDSSHEEHLARKYGITVERARQLDEQMTQAAAAEGLEFHFERMRGGNTFDAHRLLHLARGRGKQLELKERLLRATFTEGAAIGDRVTLGSLAADAGLDVDEVSAVLESERFAAEVRADEQQAVAYGISGVPFFVVDAAYGVSGAQPAEVLLQVLRRAYDERTPARVVAAAAAGCDGDACTVTPEETRASPASGRARG
jgi:predicted DsbA family dithiol-disulfide isomerase